MDQTEDELKGHVQKLEDYAKELTEALAAMDSALCGRGSSRLEEFHSLIRRPGITSRPEFRFMEGHLLSLITQSRAIQQSALALIEGTRAIVEGAHEKLEDSSPDPIPA